MPFSVNVLTGHNLLQRGLRTLESVYIASGRERDARILLDSLSTALATSGLVRGYTAGVSPPSHHA